MILILNMSLMMLDFLKLINYVFYVNLLNIKVFK